METINVKKEEIVKELVGDYKPSSKLLKTLKTVSDVLKNEPVFPEVEKVDNTDLVNKTFKILEAEFLPSNYYGEFVIVLIEKGQDRFSTSFGSHTVTAQIRKLKETGNLPIMATLVQVKSKTGKVYQKLQ